LPPSISFDPDVLAAAEAIDAELRQTTGFIPNAAIIRRLRNKEITDPALLDILAWGLHVDFYDSAFPTEVKQELVAKSLDWHTRKGTPSAVEEVVAAAFNDAEVSEWFEYGGRPYRFKISINNAGNKEDISRARIQSIIDAVKSMKNTRSWLESIIIQTTMEEPYKLNAGGAAFPGIMETELPRYHPDKTFHIRLNAGGTAFFGVVETKLPRFEPPRKHEVTLRVKGVPHGSITQTIMPQAK